MSQLRLSPGNYNYKINLVQQFYMLHFVAHYFTLLQSAIVSYYRLLGSTVPNTLEWPYQMLSRSSHGEFIFSAETDSTFRQQKLPKKFYNIDLIFSAGPRHRDLHLQPGLGQPPPREEARVLQVLRRQERPGFELPFPGRLRSADQTVGHR